MKRAVVLSGGGAKGAYQVGVLKGLKKIKYNYDIVTGTSVGALNGIFFTTKELIKLEKVWKNIRYSDVYGDDYEKQMQQKHFFIKQAKTFIKDKGLKTTGLEKLFIKNVKKKKFLNSNIDYGLVTFCVNDLKPVYIRKSELNDKNITDYVLASAAIFPAFQMRQIDKKKYIDGGYFDQIPIGLAKEMGATEAVVVDLKAIGVVRKVPDDINIITISPNNKLCSVLKFDKKEARKAIKYGYNDTLKKFNKLDGDIYTFKKGTVLKIYEKYMPIIKYDIMKMNNDRNLMDSIFEDVLITKIINDKFDCKDFLIFFEYLLNKLNIDDTKIYNKMEINNLIRKKVKSTKVGKDLKSVYYDKNTSFVNGKKYLSSLYINILLNKKIGVK